MMNAAVTAVLFSKRASRRIHVQQCVLEAN